MFKTLILAATATALITFGACARPIAPEVWSPTCKTPSFPTRAPTWCLDHDSSFDDSVSALGVSECMKIHLRYWDFEIKRCIAVTEKEWELLNIANTMTSDMENSCWKLTMGSDPDLIKCLRGDNHVRQRIANQQWVTQAERDAAHERTVARNAKDKAWRDYARCVWTFGFDNRGNCHDPG